MTETLQGFNPRTGTATGEPVPAQSPAGTDAAATAAGRAAPALAALPIGARAVLLEAVAGALDGAGPELIALADAETALGTTRLTGELARTTAQLRLFADAVREGSWCEAMVDLPDPAAIPPRPDVRRLLRAIGPVGVFAASNFPFAFSVAGGDTASALAAGCPVVVKAHPSHPGLSARTGEVVAGALRAAGAPDGTFAVLHGEQAGRDLVTHPAVRAVGFTGSLHGGRALHDLAASRPDPIPFYGELGSLNPAVVTPAAVAARGAEIARGFVGSFTLGGGQFCTKPGLLFLPSGHGLTAELTGALSGVTEPALLNARIRDAYADGVRALAAVPGVTELSGGAATGAGYAAHPALLSVSSAGLVEHAGTLLTECFGPVSLIVEYDGADDLLRALAAVPGSLTGTVHGEPDEPGGLPAVLLAALGGRAGRVIWNGWPTGVAVCWAMQHGGPWPATTAALHTSVGVTAMRRFLRPVAYQDVPDGLLPPELADANPLGLPRRVNGTPTADPVRR